MTQLQEQKRNARHRYRGGRRKIGMDDRVCAECNKKSHQILKLKVLDSHNGIDYLIKEGFFVIHAGLGLFGGLHISRKDVSRAG